jgi:hypothetical protein
MKFVLIFAMITFCQTVTVDLSKLGSVSRNEIIDLQKEEKTPVESAKEWAGIGVELGKAIASTCKELSIGVNDFVKTPVGKLAMCIILWKLVGKEILGLIIWVAITIIVLLMFRHMTGYKEIMKKDGENKIVVERVERYSGTSNDAKVGISAIIAVAWFGVTIPVLCCVFGAM